jgi:hypothetical protein
LKVVQQSPGHQLRRSSILAIAAVTALGLILVSAASTGARSLRSRTAHAAKPHSTPITPAHGARFVPQLGDWEGRANGFPVSFELLSVPRFQTLHHLPPYGYTDLTVLEPNSCPPSAGRYSESSIALGSPLEFGRRGGFGLTPVGFGGGLQAARSALLETNFRVDSGQHCSGRLVWHLHPANRIAVRDGRWKARFSDGETSTFSVHDGGRLATRLRLPHALEQCGGLVGALDVFIGARGNVAVAQAHLDVGMHFSGGTAKGRLAVPGASCQRPVLTMTASPG